MVAAAAAAAGRRLGAGGLHVSRADGRFGIGLIILCLVLLLLLVERSLLLLLLLSISDDATMLMHIASRALADLTCALDPMLVELLVRVLSAQWRARLIFIMGALMRRTRYYALARLLRMHATAAEPISHPSDH